MADGAGDGPSRALLGSNDSVKAASGAQWTCAVARAVAQSRRGTIEGPEETAQMEDIVAETRRSALAFSADEAPAWIASNPTRVARHMRKTNSRQMREGAGSHRAPRPVFPR